MKNKYLNLLAGLMFLAGLSLEASTVSNVLNIDPALFSLEEDFDSYDKQIEYSQPSDGISFNLNGYGQGNPASLEFVYDFGGIQLNHAKGLSFRLSSFKYDMAVNPVIDRTDGGSAGLIDVKINGAEISSYSNANTTHSVIYLSTHSEMLSLALDFNLLPEENFVLQTVSLATTIDFSNGSTGSDYYANNDFFSTNSLTIQYSDYSSIENMSDVIIATNVPEPSVYVLLCGGVALVRVLFRTKQ